MLRKYYVTIVFTLLALLNLLSSWGTLQYRLVMLALNLVCGFGMEYLVNKKAPADKYNLWKGCTAGILLAVNLVWIFLAK
ncbi:hypothetical protein lacNasYZ03_14300 [Lactobacillus nasalidis]|uniref:Uncharacterized protein n=1 Tax=Lactobacillus nasalidis TaxID=2797258 RepID=A0ABQ3W5C4_9LACO|nr:hypothetical protein [Lactobacillus nasalidis]GHV97048.1 hypothetical protein lacNasYZ01_02300 [Lactobacillus nasalidis]GHW00277.1 hypothetical protein lacNasYZ02_17060 [Lactobacillus nasalidis]GHW01743.1 hypothetical protein lacNasYZ03_14300 [Lactobacillus nasalidis]